jgi:hypothetical protein
LTCSSPRVTISSCFSADWARLTSFCFSSSTAEKQSNG